MPGIQAPINRTDYLALNRNVTKSGSEYVPHSLKISVQQKARSDLPLEPLSLNDNLSIALKWSPSAKLARNKLGVTLVKTIEDADFNLKDPYLYKTKFTYEALHDPTLNSYFQRKDVFAHLKKMGFISQNGDVLCSVKEFCDYTRYLDELFTEQALKIRRATVGIFLCLPSI